MAELNTEPCQTTAENESDINLVLRKLRVSNPNSVIIVHFNINYIRNKSVILQFLLTDYIDILMTSESKLDGTFPSSQFQIYGFRTPYRLNRNDRLDRNDIIVYKREFDNKAFCQDTPYSMTLKYYLQNQTLEGKIG